MKAKNKIKVKIELVGASLAKKQLDMLGKSVDKFCKIGEEHGIPKRLLLKLLEWQIDNKRIGHPADLPILDR